VPLRQARRHCEAHSDEAIHVVFWAVIASLVKLRRQKREWPGQARP
jgi:hypothetical protein